MTQSLFRQEALDANNNKVMGTVSLYSPPYRWLVISLASCLVTLIVLFIVFGSYTKKETATGNLLPSKGIYNITAPVAGTITDMQVEKGSEVEQNSVLMTISSELSTAMGQTRQFVHDQLTLQNERLQSERESEHRMHAETMSGLKKQLGSLESQIGLLKKQQVKRQQQLNLASNQLHKLQQMRSQGFASNQQVDEQQNTVLEVGARLQDADRLVMDLEQKIIALRQQLRELPLALSKRQNEIDRSQADVDRALAENESPPRRLHQGDGNRHHRRHAGQAGSGGRQRPAAALHSAAGQPAAGQNYGQQPRHRLYQSGATGDVAL
ncbi:NHLM bacteriocin system secretion protein [Serratia rubidaea]|uniref:NHLM bacteriocin system secretion protein n=1 Tax=Serratia rubidaea TaxID=61652 RepID=A0A4U9HS59_SERRU|nr:NHLM bacteriocin system secretion protein [Serratia rubidaea]